MAALISLVASPSGLPVTVAESKTDLRIQHAAEDSIIEDFISSATDYCQEVVGKKLISQEWRYSISSASFCVVLPIAVATEITEINYYDADNNLQSADINDFYFYALEDSAFVEPKHGKNWPATFARRDAISINFKVGYADAEAVPAAIKRAIRLLVAHWYECRTAATIGTEAKEIPMGVNALLGSHRIGWVS